MDCCGVSLGLSFYAMIKDFGRYGISFPNKT